MTEKEKAKELINKFIPHARYFEDGNKFSENAESAKQCALIAVDVILKDVGAEDWNDDGMTNNNYWQTVKSEIEKL